MTALLTIINRKKTGGNYWTCRFHLIRFERQKIEAYLAHKWGLTDQMPSGHPGKISGWSVGRNLSESNDISVNIGGVGVQKQPPIPLLYPPITNGITSYPPMTGAPERSILTARRYPQHPHPVRSLPPAATPSSLVHPT